MYMSISGTCSHFTQAAPPFCALLTTPSSHMDSSMHQIPSGHHKLRSTGKKRKQRQACWRDQYQDVPSKCPNLTLHPFPSEQSWLPLLLSALLAHPPAAAILPIKGYTQVVNCRLWSMQNTSNAGIKSCATAETPSRAIVAWWVLHILLSSGAHQPLFSVCPITIPYTCFLSPFMRCRYLDKSDMGGDMLDSC